MTQILQITAQMFTKNIKSVLKNAVFVVIRFSVTLYMWLQ